MDSIISVQSLTKQFKIRPKQSFWKMLFRPDFKMVQAVSNISFKVQRGEAVAFLGPNGAGKTTTTKMLTGLIYPTAGQIEVLGFTPFDRKEEYLRRIGLVMGNKAGLNWDLTAMQSFELLKAIYQIEPERYQSRLKELVELLDVQDHLQTQLRRLSLGERMKVELIGALLHSPELLFLDEPTIGLDVVSKKNIRQFLRQIHQDEGVTLVLTSHDMDDISEVCQRAVIINKGSLVYDGPLSKLTAEYQKERYIQVSFTDDPGMEELTPLAEEVELKEDGFLLKVEAAKMVPTVSALFSKFQVADIKIESVPLEDVIAEIFKGGH